jgi:transcriptional regulator with XRE-family HTH domain
MAVARDMKQMHKAGAKTTRKAARAKAKPAKSREVRSASTVSDLAVGARLRHVRERAGLSQRELAKRAGVTNATISLIEQQNHAPSLASLHRILSAIPISMAEFFTLPATQRNVLFYDKDDLVSVTRGAASLCVLGSERRDKRLQLFFERYAPGAGTGTEWIVHGGETAAVIVQGLVRLEVDGQSRHLGAGGGFQLLGKQPYRLLNVGKSEAIVVCACTPPMI